MPRLCFVIMPFSSTASCTEDEWTEIFETLFKPAVEDADLGYECTRSDIGRGNVIKDIVRRLHQAHVVLADLTDRNPNVFYELGVRHTMKNRTILLAQNREHIPFDLGPYASHVYDWKTPEGKRELQAKILSLLQDVDFEPDREDNPVSDYFQGSQAGNDTHAAAEAEQQTADTLVGENSSPEAGARLGQKIAAQKNVQRFRAVVRDARKYFRREWPVRQETLNAKHSPGGNLERSQIIDYALPIIKPFEVDIGPIEAFGSKLIESGWNEQLSLFLPLIGDWLAIPEQRRSEYRAIKGAPSICALRFLAILGAKAVEEDSYTALKTLLVSRIESREQGGSAARLTLAERPQLLFPEALLGYADIACNYLAGIYARDQHVRDMFLDQADYSERLAVFLFLWALGADFAQNQQGYTLYPGYKLINGAHRALQSLAQRLQDDPDYLTRIASVFDLSDADFKLKWKTSAERLNEAALGGRYFASDVYVPAGIFAE